MRTLIQTLNDYPLALLRGIGESYSLALTNQPTKEAVDQLSAAMLNTDSLGVVLDRLSPAGRQALLSLIASGGKQTLSVFNREHGAIRTMGPAKLARELPWRQPESAAEELWYTGLIGKVFAPVGGGLSEFVYVPDDILPLLPEPEEPTVPQFNLAPVNGNVEARPDAARGDGLLLDLTALLALAASQELPTQEGDIWSDQASQMLADYLVDGAESWPGEEPLRIAFLHHLALRLNLILAQNGFVRIHAERSRSFLEAPRPQQRTELWQAWSASPDWNDLCRVPGLSCEGGNWHNDPLLARQGIFTQLRTCRPGAWYSLADFVAALQRASPDFQRPDADYRSWYIRDLVTGQLLTGFENWPRVEGALISDMVGRTLAWLGAVQLGYRLDKAPEDPAALCFRLTARGAAFLAMREAPPEPPAEQFAVEADFTILLSVAVPLMDRFRALRVFAFEAAGPPTLLRISRTALAHARETAGIKPTQVLSFLRKSSASVPDNVVQALEKLADPRKARTNE